MTLHWTVYLAILAAPVLGGATITTTTGVSADVSATTSTVVHTGETLAFQVLSWNFGVNASAFGLGPNPTDVSFSFVTAITAPMSAPGDFAASLESEDQSVSVAFGGHLTFDNGFFQGSGYAGEVSTLNGYLHLSATQSEALFSTASAVLTLRNNGPDITVGLPPYTLRNSLYVSLYGGPLDVGAIQGPVSLQSPGNPSISLNRFGLMYLGGESPVPEPASAGLLLGGGALLCMLSALLARGSRGK